VGLSSEEVRRQLGTEIEAVVHRDQLVLTCLPS
jgi:hypothetical protein